MVSGIATIITNQTVLNLSQEEKDQNYLNMNKYKRICELAFKFIKWSVFVGLCVASYFFAHGVFDQYIDYDASFKYNEMIMSENLTITICIPCDDLQYDVDFSMSYGQIGLEPIKLLEGLNLYQGLGIDHKTVTELFHRTPT